MRCGKCEYFISQRQDDATVQMICRLDGRKRWLVDGCRDGIEKIEVVEDKALYGFDDMERLGTK